MNGPLLTGLAPNGTIRPRPRRAQRPMSGGLPNGAQPTSSDAW
jgi:hypothetical protein